MFPDARSQICADAALRVFPSRAPSHLLVPDDVRVDAPLDLCALCEVVEHPFGALDAQPRIVAVRHEWCVGIVAVRWKPSPVLSIGTLSLM